MATAARPRLLALVGLGLGGVLLGVVGAGVVTLERPVGSLTVPWGLALAVLGVACSVRGAAWLVGSRRGAVAVLLGWLVPTFAFSAVNPGGDVVLTDERRTYVYLLATFGLGLLAASWPLPSGAAELAEHRPGPLADADLAWHDDGVVGAPAYGEGPEALLDDPADPSQPVTGPDVTADRD